MHILHKEFCNDRITHHIYWELFKGDGYAKWGITQDGYSKTKSSYIQAKLKKKVPAICLLRDPISAIVSGINYYILKDMFQNKFSNKINYLEQSLHNEDFLNGTICFEKNISQLSKNTTKILYIQTQDIIGEATIKTMDKVANFLNILPPTDEEKLLLRINDSFSRCFPQTMEVYGQEVVVSTFEGIFDPKNTQTTLYNKKDTRFYIRKNYISEKFPQRPLHISTKKPIVFDTKMLSEIYKKIEEYLQEVEIIQNLYTENKLIEKDIFKYLKNHPKTLSYLKKILIEQTKIIKQNAPKIFESWLYYQKFLTDFKNTD